MAVNIDAKFEGKLIRAFKNEINIICQIFTGARVEVQKFGLLLGSFIQSRKCMSLKFTGDLCVMTKMNDAKF